MISIRVFSALVFHVRCRSANMLFVITCGTYPVMVTLIPPSHIYVFINQWNNEKHTCVYTSNQLINLH